MCIRDSRDATWTSWVPATTPATFITRPDIADGAVSDEFLNVQLGPFDKTTLPSFTVVPLTTISLGAIPHGQIWRRAFTFEVRTAVAGESYLVVVQLRGRELGGAFGAWQDVDLISDGTAVANGWEVRRSSGGFSGGYDELQYRVVARTTPAGGAGSYQWLRNVYQAFGRVTK